MNAPNHAGSILNENRRLSPYPSDENFSNLALQYHSLRGRYVP
jgi:hypothetical protein